MNSASRFILLVLSAVCFAAFAPIASAQKVSKKYFEQSEYGFRFKPVIGYDLVPPKSDQKEFGLIAKGTGKNMSIKVEGFGASSMDADFTLLRMVEKKQAIRGKIEEGATVTREFKRTSLGQYLESRYAGVKADKPTLDKEVKIRKGFMGRHRQWLAKGGGNVPVMIDAWTFILDDAHVHMVNVLPDQRAKKWVKVFKKSAKTFQLMERTEAKKLNSSMSYEELVEFYDQDERATGGWHAVATPSKRYIIKTDSDDKDFIAKVIARLEKSRDLYERDFPPATPIEHVSVVRVCGTEAVFHSYGDTGRGVAGWFSPATTELVLYDGKNTNRNSTFAVMSHEAFHQYCHFLFQESEAHRWFDEGHGDYYGGAKMGRSKQSSMIITPKMPAGLGRLGVIREMVRTETYAPLEDHLNFSHRQWQTQGPSGVSCYSQSWSIIYMLRQGTLGKVPGKVWKKEYANILPNYIKTLNEGYDAAYAKQREVRRKEMISDETSQREARKKKGKKSEGGKTVEEVVDAELKKISNGQLFRDHSKKEKAKKKIWKAAMDASWGPIDLDEFEENWTTYVKKHLK
ncbi:MAG: hypothetical protein JKY61_09070 [Planctomycetes bacterium]|nr:hypothetical protein [Planctomycetota bacterium]